MNRIESICKEFSLAVGETILLSVFISVYLFIRVLMGHFKYRIHSIIYSVEFREKSVVNFSL